jgi:cytochrome P450
MRYGPVWRQHRTLLHHRFRQEACKAYESAQNQHICDLLSQLLLDPINPFKHIKHAIGALIMDVSISAIQSVPTMLTDGSDSLWD